MAPKRAVKIEIGRKVAVIGAGYVGIPTAALLAHLGHDVTLADRDESKITRLQRGEIPIVEDGLAELVEEGVTARRLRFVVGAGAAVKDAEFVFFCLPTPQRADGSADLSAVESVAKEVAPFLRSRAVVVNKSTVPVGSAPVVSRCLNRADVVVVSNPEFLREGSAVADSLNPDRIVVGADDQGAAARVGELFAGTGAPLIVTDVTTAETIKYTSNAYLATKLSFVNSVAALCEAVGADVRDVTLGLGYDKRIGFEYLRPGPGWGGSCLPKDTAALVHIAEDSGYDFKLLKAAIAANDEQIARIVDKVLHAAGVGTSVAVWGLTFKPGTDDRRNSPALDVAQRLRAAGCVIRAFDPTVQAHETDTDGDLAGLIICDDAYEACTGASALAVLTDWEEFRWLEFARVRQAMDQPRVVDARNLLDPAAMRRLGFVYDSVGRQ